MRIDKDMFCETLHQGFCETKDTCTPVYPIQTIETHIQKVLHCVIINSLGSCMWQRPSSVDATDLNWQASACHALTHMARWQSHSG